jgi:hypothetical protein
MKGTVTSLDESKRGELEIIPLILVIIGTVMAFSLSCGLSFTTMVQLPPIRPSVTCSDQSASKEAGMLGWDIL